MKYIQDTKEWKEVEKRAGMSFEAELTETMDKAIIKALGGPVPKVPKPPRGPGLT